METYLEIKLDIEYDYTPQEKAITTGPADHWHPGSPAEVEITSVKYNDKEIELTEKHMEEIKERCFEDAEQTNF